MTVKRTTFYLPDNHSAGCRLAVSALNSSTAPAIRNAVQECIRQKTDFVYLDVKDVTEATLSGINEIIHAHYILWAAKVAFVLVFRQKSLVEKWVSTTGLDQFIETAIVAAI